VLLAGALTGVVYSSLLGVATRHSPLLSALDGAGRGTAIAGRIGLAEIWGTRTRVSRAIGQARFLVMLAIKGIAYGTIILAVLAADPGASPTGVPGDAAPLRSPFSPLSIVFSFAATFAFIFILQISRLVGRRVHRDLVLGRYHRPRIEERFFLFIDIVGSTTLAERLGPIAVHRFLDRVFRLAADPVDDRGGEIYQYVGDELVIGWTIGEGRVHGRALACFLAVEAALGRAASGFQGEFGSAPRLRGALHAGPVVVGEVGETKRDIVFHGDVMNTAARLEQAARELDRRFVVSAEALERLPGLDGHALEDLGVQAIRGRAAPIRVYAVEAIRGTRARAGEP